MTQQEFTAEFRHEIDGWMLDAAMVQRSGAELSVFLRMMRGKIERKLGEMWNAMHPKEPPTNNGTGSRAGTTATQPKETANDQQTRQPRQAQGADRPRQ